MILVDENELYCKWVANQLYSNYINNTAIANAAAAADAIPLIVVASLVALLTVLVADGCDVDSVVGGIYIVFAELGSWPRFIYTLSHTDVHCAELSTVGVVTVEYVPSVINGWHSHSPTQ